MTSQPAPQRPTLEQPPQFVIDEAVRCSLRSPCRSKRGAVVFKDGNIIGVGRNFKPWPLNCDGSEACKQTCSLEAIHAEQDALSTNESCYDADILHVKSVDGWLVPSGVPSCAQCSKAIVARRLAGVWLFHEDGWRRYDSVEFHKLSIQNDKSTALSQLLTSERKALEEVRERNDGFAAYAVWPSDPEAIGPFFSPGSGRLDVFRSRRRAESFRRQWCSDPAATIVPVKVVRLVASPSPPHRTAQDGEPPKERNR